MRRRTARGVLAILFCACLSCSRVEQSPPASAATPLAKLPDIDQAAVLAHTVRLSSDEFEGRAPGTKGESLSVDYIVDQFKKLGLQPGNTNGTYIQEVPLVGIAPDGAPLLLKKGGDERRLKWKDDAVIWTKHVAESASLKDSELVFVGYGVVAPEYNWDDYKGVDVKGKTLVMLINDPPVPDPATPSQLDPNTFRGKAMTYYGRWTYKFEIAAKKGAAGVLIIHETVPAGYGFGVVQSSWSGEQFTLATPDKNIGEVAIEGWVTLDSGKQLLQMAGQDFDALKKQAATREFKPVPLGIRASVTLHNTLRPIASRNVIARLDGSDPDLRQQYVVYTAHWDHLGIGPSVNGDSIYNGAIDNASGVAGILEIARAYTKLPRPPKRSIVFLSVTAEEQGLLGSQYYARLPVYPLDRTLANINIDGLNVHGKTKDLTVIGYGASDLDDYVRAATAEQGRVVRPDAEPEKGFYYRSDHFNFAKAGVPALYCDAGVDFIGRPAGYSQKLRDEYTTRDYHKPSDEVRPDWDLSGAAEDLKVLFAVGYRVAEAAKAPEWKPGNEFKAVREGSLASTGPEHAKIVEAWRAKHEADYTREYVRLAGLFFLKPGVNTAGSAPASDVKLPARVPASVGRFVFENQHVRFEPGQGSQGSPVTLKGKPVAAALDLRTDDSNEYDELTIGDVVFWVHESGDRRAIRILDPQGQPALTFSGFKWFPIDPAARVVARFIKDSAPREMKVPNLLGDLEEYKTEGVVEFFWQGQTLRLRPMTTRPNRFFFIFRDSTSGKETYDAARFLYTDLDPDGKTVLDFNEAYNPPCAFNEFTTCPLPLPENRLKVPILAGEKAYRPHP